MASDRRSGEVWVVAAAMTLAALAFAAYRWLNREPEEAKVSPTPPEESPEPEE